MILCKVVCAPFKAGGMCEIFGAWKHSGDLKGQCTGNMLSVGGLYLAPTSAAADDRAGHPREWAGRGWGDRALPGYLDLPNLRANEKVCEAQHTWGVCLVFTMHTLPQSLL